MSKINLFTDEIIFRMQCAGGVSTVWGEILSRVMDDPDVDLRIVSTDAPVENVVYREKGLADVEKVPERHRNLLLQRMTEAHLPKRLCGEGNSIFNSTYFRTAAPSGVINVLHIHDFTHQLYFPKKQASINSVLKRKCIRNSDAIVCISQNTKDDLLKFFPEASEKRVEVIYNGVSPEYRFDSSLELPSVIRGRGVGKFVMYVGSRAPYKRFGIALEIIKRFDWLSLVVVGGGALSDEEKADVGSAADRVVQISGVSTQELNALYSNAVALVYPSAYEGFGIPPLEAMRSGCPAIAFRNSSLPEVMGDAGILLDEGDLDGLEAAVCRLVDDEAWRGNIVEAQLNQAGQFTWDNSYNKLKGLYLSLIEERKGR